MHPDYMETKPVENFAANFCILASGPSVDTDLWLKITTDLISLYPDITLVSSLPQNNPELRELKVTIRKLGAQDLIELMIMILNVWSEDFIINTPEVVNLS